MADLSRNSGPPVTTDSIGQPFTFHFGPYAHQTLRTELRVLQEALFCRKTSPRDRRSLEPPPVISVVLYRVTHDDQGTATEVEISDYGSVPYVGLTAHVDIFEVPLSVGNASVAISAQDAGNPEVYASIGGAPLGKECLASHELAGSTMSSALPIPLADAHALLFVFPDLSCRKEGLFVPRYRCMYVVSQTLNSGDSLPILAEVWGRPFRVYSANEQPMLPASTELTKELLRLGVPVHARAKESGKRKRRKKGGGASASDEQPTDGTSSHSQTSSEGSG